MPTTLNVETISLNKLIPSSANVRKTGATTGIEELAASIKAHGLLQNLQVKPASNGTFEVVAGGRRLAALKLLAKQKHHPKTIGIACNVLGDEDASEISLAENTVRLPMHPADQFDAFTTLAGAGSGVEAIAARFGITPGAVRQRLKLAAVSPCLLDLYREAVMTLDQLMAFTVSDDHAAQEAAWFDQPAFNRDPDDIRRTLTAAHIEADHSRVRFVGIDAYSAAGGLISRDLFQPEHDGYLTDPALLDRLVTEKLEAEAVALRAEGWAWVTIMPSLDWDTLHRFGRLRVDVLPLAPEQVEERNRLAQAYDNLAAEHGDDPEPAILEELQAIEAQLDGIGEGARVWCEDDQKRSGAIISIGKDGCARIERGLIRPEDKAAQLAVVREAGGEISSIPAIGFGLSDRMVADLTAQRSAALRVMLADSPTVALAAVAHTLTLAVFYATQTGATESGGCLGIRANSDDLRRSADSIEDSAAFKALEERKAVWARCLPGEASELWGWLLAQPGDVVGGLLAYCAGSTVNAVCRPSDRRGAGHLTHADQLADALNLDMARWWQPTAASYLGRVSKAAILDAVSEGCSPSAAMNLTKLKKDALILHAEERLASTGWLPPLLRRVCAEAPVPIMATAA